MSEQSLLPSPDEPDEPVVVSPKQQLRDLVPWYYGLGFIVLAVAIFYLWQYPSTPSGASEEASAIQTLEQRLADMDARLTKLEQKPGPDLDKITGRLDAMEGRVAVQTQMGSRLDSLSARIESLSGRDQTGIDAIKQQVEALTARTVSLETGAGNLEAVTKRLNKIARLQEASFALASGKPLGNVAGAPEALARYAQAAPPTEAELRLHFPVAEQAALAAEQPDATNAPFMDRILEKAQGLITIRRGNEVVVGNSAAITLNQAQAALEAGDLSGAVDAVAALKGQPAQAMAGWLADAKALRDARSALADMADQA